MWGTIARMRTKPGHEQGLLDVSREELAAHRPPGFVSTLIYRSAGDPQELWMTVAFESEEAYRSNAASPEQDAWYRRMLEHLDGEPEWHDGEVVQTF
jgi:quinol monooxygenase YgiN